MMDTFHPYVFAHSRVEEWVDMVKQYSKEYKAEAIKMELSIMVQSQNTRKPLEYPRPEVSVTQPVECCSTVLSFGGVVAPG